MCRAAEKQYLVLWLRHIVVSLDQRPRVARWRARCVLTVKFAWLGWRVAILRERAGDRRESLLRALGR
jgi:hypothetical protein